MRKAAKMEGLFPDWIESRHFLTRVDRFFVAELLFNHFYDPTYPTADQLEASGFEGRFPNWAMVFRELIGNLRLRNLTRDQEQFALSVTREALSWCIRTHAIFSAQHHFQGEESHLRHLRAHLDSTPPNVFLQRLDDLRVTSPEQQATWRFYTQTFEAEMQNPESISSDVDAAIMREAFLDDWTKALQARQLKAEQAFLPTAWASYHDDIQSKAECLEEIQDIIEPFSQFLGQAWNNSMGNWRAMNLDQIRILARQLKSDEQLQELIEWLGRWQSNQKSLDLKRSLDPLPKNRWHPNPYGKSEIIGIHHSNHLDAVLPSEIALLSSEETEIIFSLKFIEHKLLTLQYRSMDVERKKDPHQAPQNPSASDMNGPFVLCIDTSGSMYGRPEQVAKGLALAIMEVGLRDKRPAYLITFSTGLRAIELTGMESDWPKLMNFLKMSFHGSTDLQPALEEIARILKEKRFRKADVLVISDFLIPRLNRDLLLRIKELKLEQGVRFHSMYIGKNPDLNHVPLSIFDHHWNYDLDHPSVLRQWVSYIRAMGGKSE